MEKMSIVLNRKQVIVLKELTEQLFSISQEEGMIPERLDLLVEAVLTMHSYVRNQTAQEFVIDKAIVDEVIAAAGAALKVLDLHPWVLGLKESEVVQTKKDVSDIFDSFKYAWLAQTPNAVLA